MRRFASKSFGFRALIFDPYLPDGFEKALGGVVPSLQEFLSMIDLLSIHFPLTPETRHLICAHPCNK